MKKVIKLYYLFFIELCCAFCLYKNLHPKHKVLEINDEEALKKENITIDNSSKEFDDKIEKLNNLKKAIEHEMEEIDNNYIKVDKETTKSYEIKREKLNKEEEDLKEQLKTEVTKIKEKLEINLSRTNNLIKICERIVKGIKIFLQEEKNMNKILSYISMINKNEKEINKLTKEFMKNLKISFIEEKSTIKYEEYYFNGFPVPKDIELKEIGMTYFKVFWNLDNINLKNIDHKQIKYIIELKKENCGDKFNKIYESDKTNYLVDNLESNKGYEIRICSIYKGVKSNWSELKKIKTKILDSKILNDSERGYEFLKKLYEWTGCNKMELLYRGTRDGTDSNIFHNKCDNQGATICLCQNEKGNIYGGYASISWSNDTGNYKYANDCFIFTLTNMYETSPTKYPCKNKNNAVYHYKDYGPVFGSGYGLKICGNYLKEYNSYATIGNDYQDVLGKGYSVFSGDLKNEHFKLKELEVFKIFN